MTDLKTAQRLDSLENALRRLREALAEPETNSLVIDGTIQRFEFVVELYWKTLKRFLAFEGIETQTPREALQQAYQARWLEDETVWLGMLRDRNLTSHIYDESQARKVYARIKEYFPELQRSFEFLRSRFQPGT